jgi:thiamine-monophosphate kinase
LRNKPAKALLVYKTDSVVEGVHFTPQANATQVGHKALARPLSDLAAMGARPWAALVTLGLRADASQRYVEAIFRGLGATARRYGVNLVGGETTRSKDLFLSVSILGTVSGHAPVLRSGARAGDQIWVTGRLGRTLRTKKHLTFTPRLKEGEWLARRGLARAMMDVSDGLAADLPRMAQASGLDFVLHEASIPRAKGATLAQALEDGEDYELVFAVRPQDARRLARSWPFATPLSCIGQFYQALPKSMGRQVVYGGYDHFKKP